MPLTIFEKRFTLDAWQGSEYTSVYGNFQVLIGFQSMKSSREIFDCS